MKIIKDKIAKLSFVALLITMIAAMFHAPDTSADDYINGYDDFTDNQGEIRDSNEYIEGYEDAQNLRIQQEYERRLREEREPVDEYRDDDYE